MVKKYRGMFWMPSEDTLPPKKTTTVLPEQDLFPKTEISTDLTGLGGLTTQGVCKKTSV